MNNEKKPHFWIPDNEVQQVSKKPTSRTKPRDVVYTEHGANLSNGLERVKKSLHTTESENSLAEIGLCVFKVELPEGEKIQYKAELFAKNGMQVNAVKDERSAVVSTTNQQFQILKNRIGAYTEQGTNKTHFDYIESFSPYVGSEKDSNELKKRVYLQRPPETVDVQLMFIPNLRAQEYTVALKKVIEKIQQSNGIIQQNPYYLSDNTPVIRVIIPSKTLAKYENDSAIYRIEETRFFSAGVDEYVCDIPSSTQIDPSVDIGSLPIVVVLDTGIQFHPPLDCLIVEHWNTTTAGGDCSHGTRVASKVVFSNLYEQLASGILTPRARVVDCNILSDSVPENVLIQRIQNAVTEYADIVKIYNLSANSSTPVEGDEMSIIGFELDALQLKKNVQFVVSAGNHQLWKTESSLEEILDDDDGIITAPADSMLSIVVGAVVFDEHLGSLSGKNIIAPYSRRGPGFSGFSKPDITAYGGTIVLEKSGESTVPVDSHSLVITSNGTVVTGAGTSFTSPAVAGDLAEILSGTPNSEILLAKALLYHNAVPLWESDDMDDDDLAFAHNLYGRGLTSVGESKFSTKSKVTFVRTGALNRITKERVRIFMPEILAAQKGRNVAQVKVTCISQPSVDRTKGSEYLGAYVRASLKKSQPNGSLLRVEQQFKQGRKKWDVCHQFSRTFSDFNSGDWQVWLELFSRWDEDNSEVPYALVATIEDVSGTLDVYSEIQAQNRYQAVNTIRIKVGA